MSQTLNNSELLKQQLREFYSFAKKELKLEQSPRLFIIWDEENAEQVLGKTGAYDPNQKSIQIYVHSRHPKDIVRTFSHELIHYCQDLEGRMVNEGDINQSQHYFQHNKAILYEETLFFACIFPHKT